MNAKRFVILTGILFLAIGVLTIGAKAQEEPNGESVIPDYKFIAMAISVSITCVGAGYAVGHTGSASIASITEKPELFGRTIIYVGMAEGIAIYGLLISFLIWVS